MKNAHCDGENKVSIYDIAKHVGVASSTVARALNGNPKISKKTREMVHEAAAKMGYRPSLIAKALSMNQTHTLGVVVPVLADSANFAVIRGIERVASEHGYSIVLAFSNASHEDAKRCYDLLEQRRVEAVLTDPFDECYGEDQASPLLALEDRGIPVVVMCQNIAEDSLTKVCGDNFGDVKRLVRHLISVGHERIGFAHVGLPAGAERLEGYKAALAEAGISYREELVTKMARRDFETLENYPVQREVADYLSSSERPTAIVAVQDMLAIKIIRACWVLGIRVPEDVAVVGYDDIMVSAHTIPSLTTVHPPSEEIGRVAAELAFQRISDGSTSHVHQRILGKLVVRESCGARLYARRDLPVNSFVTS